MLVQQKNTKIETCRYCLVRKKGICEVFGDQDIETIDRVVWRRNLVEGECLYLVGEDSSYFFNIISGGGNLVIDLPDGRTLITGFVYPGDTIGFSECGKYSCSVQAITPIRICVWKREVLLKTLDSHSRFRFHLLDLIQKDLAVMQNHALLLGSKTALERVSSFLLLELERSKGQNLGDKNLYLTMLRKDIAEYLGLTVETVCRIFSELKKLEIIYYKKPGRKITVKNVEYLKNYSLNCLENTRI